MLKHSPVTNILFTDPASPLTSKTAHSGAAVDIVRMPDMYRLQMCDAVKCKQTGGCEEKRRYCDDICS